VKTFQIIKSPLVTEKSSVGQALNKYFFAVDPKATKHDVRSAVQEIFKVKVISVQTMNLSGKWKRVGKNEGSTPAWKKAIVTLKEGDRIEFLEGA
jgi:Ribosomal protein L23